VHDQEHKLIKKNGTKKLGEHIGEELFGKKDEIKENQ
jgi:hypothetical protein